MSNAATNGGDATSTSREGLQQVRLAESLPKNWAVRVLVYSGRPAFLAITSRRHTRITNRRRAWVSLRLWRFDTQLTILALRKTRPHFGPRFDPSARNGTDPAHFLAQHGAGFLRHGLATLLPRLGVTPRGRNAADGGRLTAFRGQRLVGASTGGPSFGLRGSEFVSKFETKQDQSAQRA